jgi:hypothetical protein
LFDLGGKTMTAKELATILDCREYGAEITVAEARRAAESGLVVVYCHSDDNIEFYGAIDDEVGCYGGSTIKITKAGVLNNPNCDNDDCPYYAAAKDGAKSIEAIWSDDGNPCWTIDADIPHEKFRIYENTELFCIGIVFRLEDLA